MHKLEVQSLFRNEVEKETSCDLCHKASLTERKFFSSHLNQLIEISLDKCYFYQNSSFSNIFYDFQFSKRFCHASWPALYLHLLEKDVVELRKVYSGVTQLTQHLSTSCSQLPPTAVQAKTTVYAAPTLVTTMRADTSCTFCQSERFGQETLF